MKGGAAPPGSSRGRRKRGCTSGTATKSKPHCSELCKPCPHCFELAFFLSYIANTCNINAAFFGGSLSASEPVEVCSEHLERLDDITGKGHLHARIPCIATVCTLAKRHCLCRHGSAGASHHWHLHRTVSHQPSHFGGGCSSLPHARPFALTLVTKCTVENSPWTLLMQATHATHTLHTYILPPNNYHVGVHFTGITVHASGAPESLPGATRGA